MTWPELWDWLLTPGMLLNPFAWFLFLIWLFLLACALCPIVGFIWGLWGLVCDVMRNRP